MGKFSIDGSAGNKILTAEGRLAVQDAAQLRELLLEAHADKDNLFVDLTNAEYLDLSCIQVFCAANKAFQDSGKQISILKPLSQEITLALQDSALKPGSCDAEPSGQCLWATGGFNE